MVIEPHTFWWYAIGTVLSAIIWGAIWWTIKEAVYEAIKKYFDKE